MSVQQINLLNPGLLVPKVLFSSRAIVRMLFVVVSLGLLAWFWALGEAGEARAQMQQAQAERDALQSQIDARIQPGDDGQTAEDKQSRMLAASRQRLQQLRRLETALGAVRGAAGFSPRLRALASEGLPGVWLTGIELSADGFRLEGRALQPSRIPDYLALLARQPAFDSLPLSGFRLAPPESASGETGPAPGVAFEVNPAAGAQP